MNEEDIERIPLKNLPASGLIAYEYDEWVPGDPIPANNILIACLDNLDKVFMVGRIREDGKFFLASSVEDPEEMLHALHMAIQFLEDNN